MRDLIGIKVAPEQRIKAAGAATAADLAAINTLTLKTLTAKDVAVYTLKVANDQIDRDNERFATECLQDFADTLPGKGLLEGHEWGPVGIGMFFKSWVEPDPVSGVTWLMGRCYMLTADEDAASMITKVDGGVAKWVSIGFFCPERVSVETGTGKTYQEYRRGPAGEKCESLECSLVFLGAQYDAAVVKAMGSRLEEAVAKDGRVLSEKNLSKLRAARDAVDEVIQAHEASRPAADEQRKAPSTNWKSFLVPRA